MAHVHDGNAVVRLVPGATAEVLGNGSTSAIYVVAEAAARAALAGLFHESLDAVEIICRSSTIECAQTWSGPLFANGEVYDGVPSIPPARWRGPRSATVLVEVFDAS